TAIKCYYNSMSRELAEFKTLRFEPELLSVPVNLGRNLSQQEVDVDLAVDYPSPGNMEEDNDHKPYALQYPGKRPKSHYVLLGDRVIKSCQISTQAGIDFCVNTHDEIGETLVFSLEDVLKVHNAAPITERYPVISFGSN